MALYLVGRVNLHFYTHMLLKSLLLSLGVFYNYTIVTLGLKALQMCKIHVFYFLLSSIVSDS